MAAEAEKMKMVNMNEYNLPMETIIEEWTANLTPQTDLVEEGIYLGAKSSKQIVADSVKVAFPRKPDTGLGILLQEIAGGREDGLGITIVTGLVEGGAADKCGLLEGDSISKISIVRKGVNKDLKTMLAETEEEISVSTECLGYDATVDSILSLPPVETDDEYFVLTAKRLRRKPKVSVKLQYPPSQKEKDVTIELFSGENLRRAMLTRGVKLNDPLSKRFDNGGSGDCGAEGSCTTCAVSVLRGGDLLSPAGIQEKQMMDDTPRWRLACKAIVGHGYKEGEMVLRVNPRQWEKDYYY